MEQHEKELIEKYAESNSELKHLWEEHLLYQKQIDMLEEKSFLTPTEEQTVKQLKKQKLEGKTRLIAMLDQCKAQEQ